MGVEKIVEISLYFCFGEVYSLLVWNGIFACENVGVFCNAQCEKIVF